MHLTIYSPVKSEDFEKEGFWLIGQVLIDEPVCLLSHTWIPNRRIVAAELFPSSAISPLTITSVN